MGRTSRKTHVSIGPMLFNGTDALSRDSKKKHRCLVVSRIRKIRRNTLVVTDYVGSYEQTVDPTSDMSGVMNVSDAYASELKVPRVRDLNGRNGRVYYFAK